MATIEAAAAPAEHMSLSSGKKKGPFPFLKRGSRKEPSALRKLEVAAKVITPDSGSSASSRYGRGSGKQQGVETGKGRGTLRQQTQNG